jgi:hypothetical protein
MMIGMEEEPISPHDIAWLQSKLDAIDAMTANVRGLLKQLSVEVERRRLRAGLQQP